MGKEKDFDWGRDSPEAEEAWHTFNRTGDRTAVVQAIYSMAEAMEPRRLWMVYIWTLTQARQNP